jgi:hypothetical protein
MGKSGPVDVRSHDQQTPGKTKTRDESGYHGHREQEEGVFKYPPSRRLGPNPPPRHPTTKRTYDGPSYKASQIDATNVWLKPLQEQLAAA